jgi:predicted CoA-substrate-specific enzyme activase
MRFAGIDVGSVSVKVVVTENEGAIAVCEYVRHKGKPLEVAADLLEQVATEAPIDRVAATGTGAKQFAALTGAFFVNEIVAVSKAFSRLYPETRTVIDIGGEDSKLIVLEAGDNGLRVRDFSMNALCAAGTGSFLDQQASRLRYTIEEFSEVALRSTNPPRLAGRCTVFAKSDMIHLQQIATPDFDIVAGLCYALARSFKGSVARGKEINAPVAFVGGVAANAGMRKALRDVFSLEEYQFFVPDYFLYLGALGAVYALTEDGNQAGRIDGLTTLRASVNGGPAEDAHPSLPVRAENLRPAYDIRSITKRTEVYLGVDVGSISTNLVVIDSDRNVIAKRYLMTEGRPLEAVKRGLAEIGEEVGALIDVVGAGTTGSGRYLTADFIGADIVRNEITAQAEAAISIDGDVDTIFEIGGQDSKYVSIDHGVVVDFEMNKACAAGTGSFLEEQAERLGISIIEEFGSLALGAHRPVKMGERCTVFMESDVVHHLQRGTRTADIVAGLSYSIVANYLNKVVGDRRIGKKIFFQGGTAFNQGVVAAFERTLGRPIIVPPHHDVTGAIGVAILAMKNRAWQKSAFKGFDLSKRSYCIDTFECKGCENLCEIRKVTVEKESPLYYGSRCDKYDVVRRTQKRDVADLVSLRSELLRSAHPHSAGSGEPIGLPMLLNMWELLPFWMTFLTEIGYAPVLSDPTNKKTIREGVENIIFEACFPVKLAHGQVLNLINRGIKRIFLPSMVNMRRPIENVSNTFACPYAQSFPYTVKASIDFRALGVCVDTPVIYFGQKQKTTLKNLADYVRQLGRSRGEARRAFEKALQVQEGFYRRLAAEGRNAAKQWRRDDIAVVLVGRPYNSTDPGANLNIHRKLADLGVQSIPLDMLPGADYMETDEDLKNMYWAYGHRILKAARIIREERNLYPVYITNFGCGPDSFISHFFKAALQGKPFLQLEIDEHSADGGAVTRLEAFLDSVRNARGRQFSGSPTVIAGSLLGRRNRKVYIPNMCDHAIPFAGAFRACGVDAAAMDEPDEESLNYGRKHTSGKECYPCALTTGDMVKMVKRADFDRDHTAFFMPSGSGPCRFGQYNKFHRMVLDELGFPDVPIYAPNQDDRLYQDLGMGDTFQRLGWRAIVATDLCMKMLHEVRPHEKTKGQADRAYWDTIAAVTAAIERGNGSLVDVLAQGVRAFRDIEQDKPRKPIVTVVGEVYVRHNRFSNSNLIRKVEEFGGQVWLASFGEWISYVNYLRGHRMSGSMPTLSELVRLFIVQHVQHKEERTLERIFERHLGCGREPDVADIINKARPYVPFSFEGEAILTVGKAIDGVERGACGIINAIPFTCMPGTIAGALLAMVQKKYDIPVFHVAYDGQGITNITTRLEAFMHQVKERAKRG